MSKHLPGPWRLSCSDGFETEDEIADIHANGPYGVVCIAAEVALDEARLIACARAVLAGQGGEGVARRAAK